MNNHTRQRLIMSKRLTKRDGLHCHYCGAEIVPSFIFKRLQGGTAPTKKTYREAANALAHGARMATLDHKTPKARGGPLSLDNTVLACLECNHEKGARDYSEFVQIKRATSSNYLSACFRSKHECAIASRTILTCSK